MIFAILTGLSWAGISIMMSTVARNRISVFLFYWIGNTISAVAAWLFMPDWSAFDKVSGKSLTTLILLLFFAGFVNVASQAVMVLTLKLGHNGISIVVRNCAAVIPFLTGVLLWNNRVGITGFIGLAMIFSGMAGIVLGRNATVNSPSGKVSLKWLIAVAASLALSGSYQLLNSFTARLSPETLETGIRIPLLLTSGATGNCIAFFLSRKTEAITADAKKLLLWMTVGWSVLAIISNSFMFKTLDVMTSIGASALVYPIVIGVNIMTFSLYSRFRLKERYTWLAICSLLLCVSGIIFLTLK